MFEMNQMKFKKCFKLLTKKHSNEQNNDFSFEKINKNKKYHRLIYSQSKQSTCIGWVCFNSDKISEPDNKLHILMHWWEYRLFLSCHYTTNVWSITIGYSHFHKWPLETNQLIYFSSTIIHDFKYFSSLLVILVHLFAKTAT